VGARRSVRRHEALQLLEPVLHDDKARGSGTRIGRHDVIRHQEPLTVRRNIVRSSRVRGDEWHCTVQHPGRRAGRPCCAAFDHDTHK
jgi:hypothetical protein